MRSRQQSTPTFVQQASRGTRETLANICTMAAAAADDGDGGGGRQQLRRLTMATAAAATPGLLSPMHMIHIPHA